MRSRLRFLHLRSGAVTDGVTEKGSSTGFWTPPRSHVARRVGKSARRDG